MRIPHDLGFFPVLIVTDNPKFLTFGNLPVISRYAVIDLYGPR
jgi:hypothetical protein